MAISLIPVAFGLVCSLNGAEQAKAKTQYFPPHAFADLKHSRYLDGRLQESWFSAQLEGLREPSLFGLASSTDTVYRVTVLPSFSHPISVRIVIRADGSATATTTIGQGAGGYAPKGVLSQHTRMLTAGEATSLKEIVLESRFWSRPTEPNQQRGTDGTEWLIEGFAGGQYHAVDRWEGGDMRELGLFMLQKIGQPGPEADLKSAIE